MRSEASTDAWSVLSILAVAVAGGGLVVVGVASFVARTAQSGCVACGGQSAVVVAPVVVGTWLLAGFLARVVR